MGRATRYGASPPARLLTVRLDLPRDRCRPPCCPSGAARLELPHRRLTRHRTAMPLPWRWVSKPNSAVIRPEPESVARRPSDRAATVVKVGLGPETKKMGFRFGDASPPASRLPVAASFVRLVAGRRWLPVAVAQLTSVCHMEETLIGSHDRWPWGDDGAPI
ncbi:hypothetical protein ACLOJK_018513 [Asimina triloba]